MNTVDILDLGQVPYKKAWDLQARIQQKLIDEKRAAQKGQFNGKRRNDALLFVEHPHVYTLGKSGDISNPLHQQDELDQIEAEFVKNDRGGDITYHVPGQIVGYPILDLDRYFTDIHKYLRLLEEVIIRVCAEYSLVAGRMDKATGVWVGNSKICAMGIKCSRWVTMHGFAFNIHPQLEYFKHIIPCGISDKQVSSLNELTGREISQDEVKERLIANFATVFDVKLNHVDTLPEIQMDEGFNQPVN